jgi:hypothetical protein
MQSRTLDRLKQLEAKIAPKAHAFVFVFFDPGRPDRQSRDEQLAAFRVEHGIGPSDPIHEVSVTFC